MTKEQFATLLNGREYGNEITSSEESTAKENGLVVVFGASDDLMEFRGAMNGELGAYEGTVAHLTDDSLFEEYESACECECKYYVKAKEKCKTITALWCPPTGGSWAYETDIPHATFNIYEDGELYCTGIVFEVTSLSEKCKMIELVHAKITLHFEVLDAEIFGGEGSVGYTSTSFDPSAKILIQKGEAGVDSIVATLTAGIVNLLKVTPDKVRLISKAEHDENMEDDEE